MAKTQTLTAPDGTRYAIHPETGEQIPYTPPTTAHPWQQYPVVMHVSPGRTPSCSPDLTASVCLYISKGAYADAAAAAAGIPLSTFYQWLTFADRDEKLGKRPGWEPRNKDTSVYMAFSDSLKLARVAAEAAITSKLHDAEGDRTWTRLAWILERTRPDRYGQRQTIEHDIVSAGPNVPQRQPETHEQWLAVVQRERLAMASGQAEGAQGNKQGDDFAEGAEGAEEADYDDYEDIVEDAPLFADVLDGVTFAESVAVAEDAEGVQEAQEGGDTRPGLAEADGSGI